MTATSAPTFADSFANFIRPQMDGTKRAKAPTKGKHMKLRKAALRLMVAAVILISTAVVAPQMAGAATISGSGVFWVDNVGAPAGPGREHDAHLVCDDINLWANGVDIGSGTYVIYGVPPTGTGEVVYRGTAGNPVPATWTYDESLGGNQVADRISVDLLIFHSIIHGDTPVNGQGYHLQKNVTFWVNC
jgi:hypothetical protein